MWSTPSSDRARPWRRLASLLGGLALLTAAACARHVQVGSPPAPPAPAPPPAPDPVPPGERVVRSMFEMYQGQWYRNVTFVQRTTITVGNLAPIVQTWYEAASLPGKLRIDVEDPSRGNGTLYRGDSVYRIANGVVNSVRRDMNDLLILGFDVYAQPPATTARILRERGFDLGKTHETTWQGKPVVVVGALAGDTTSKQFWVEKERLLFVRLIEMTPQGRSDTRFQNYVRAHGGWIAVHVENYLAGRLRLKEEYSDVSTNVDLDPALFEPERWSTARHWRR